MKVLNSGPERLVVRTWPWLLQFQTLVIAGGFVAVGVALIVLRRLDPLIQGGGGILIAIGVVILVGGLFRAQKMTLVLDRALGTAVVTRSSIFHRVRREYPLGDLTKLIAFGPGHSLHMRRTFRLALKLRDQRMPLPLTNYLSATKPCFAVAKEVNAWLRAPDPDPTPGR